MRWAQFLLISFRLVALVCLSASAQTGFAQETGGAPAKPVTQIEKIVEKGAASVIKPGPPSFQTRIEEYHEKKIAAANAHLPPPKPTSAILLDEIKVAETAQTTNGWRAIVETTTEIKLSYVVSPGEKFFDGELLTIEAKRVVFRRDIVWKVSDKPKTAGSLRPYVLGAVRRPMFIDATDVSKPSSFRSVM
ncbi:MAG TPA: hypothetical protein VK557_14460 [Pyrinomonadaceae bacterium]|nr:hypothetical protein [Pyrinomonadaceae bacterium]